MALKFICENNSLMKEVIYFSLTDLAFKEKSSCACRMRSIA